MSFLPAHFFASLHPLRPRSLFCGLNRSVVCLKRQQAPLQLRSNCVPLSHNSCVWSTPLRSATEPCPTRCRPLAIRFITVCQRAKTLGFGPSPCAQRPNLVPTTAVPLQLHSSLRVSHSSCFWSKLLRLATEPCPNHWVPIPLVHARIPNLVLAHNRLERLERKKEGYTPPPRRGGG